MPPTTLMMRNIPNRYVQGELLSDIKVAGFADSFDFFYLPMDHYTGANFGYCFINMLTPQLASNFHQAFHAKPLKRFTSKKIVSIVPATIQGFEANLKHYSRKAVCGDMKAQFRPLFWVNGTAIEFLRKKADPGTCSAYKATLRHASTGDSGSEMTRADSRDKWNVPGQYTRSGLIEEIDDAGFQGKFDFFYLPFDRYRRRNDGYCLVNLEDYDTMKRFAAFFHGRRVLRLSIRWTTEVVPAVLQGFEANLRHYHGSPVFKALPEEYELLTTGKTLALNEELSSWSSRQASDFDEMNPTSKSGLRRCFLGFSHIEGPLTLFMVAAAAPCASSQKIAVPREVPVVAEQHARVCRTCGSHVSPRDLFRPLCTLHPVGHLVPNPHSGADTEFQASIPVNAGDTCCISKKPPGFTLSDQVAVPRCLAFGGPLGSELSRSGQSASSCYQQLDYQHDVPEARLKPPRSSRAPEKKHSVAKRDRALRKVRRYKHIPNRYTQSELIAEINTLGFGGTFDFFYLPIDHNTRANYGYCFINFTAPSVAALFSDAVSGKQLQQSSSRKVVQIVPAKLQGFDANLLHYSKKAVATDSEEEFRPIFLVEGYRLTFSRVPLRGSSEIKDPWGC
ncbi:hypothetical protein FOL47_000479 [Perkinsus chesapeaki]|uniref:Mei2-like C-terminal RNA recognition motif domain-containing protein n=1 Tax=Perkinsus chesapeaki TaxID=330153 RepID=A0A7J6MMM6_PERCH|nr:hypothetical protein FOL47_000479 [Perkinsus chesapeaki]